MSYYRYGQRQVGYGALGVVSCAKDAAEAVANGSASIDTKKGREDLAVTSGNCLAAAACTAMGGAIVSELCGQIGGIIAEVLIDIFNDIADWFGGSAAKARKKARDKIVAATNNGYLEVQDVIWKQWYGALDRSTKLVKKLFNRKLTLEEAMHLFAPYLKLDQIPGTNQLRPRFMNDPPACYPGVGCAMSSSNQGYVWLWPGERLKDSPHWCVSSKSQQEDILKRAGVSNAVSQKFTKAACPVKVRSDFLYAVDRMPKMLEYVVEMINAEVLVGLSLADRKAKEVAEAETARAAAVRADQQASYAVKLKRYKEQLRASRIKREQRDQWLPLLTQGSWGMLWRPKSR